MFILEEEVSLNNCFLGSYQYLYQRKIHVQNLICATFQYNEKQVTATGLESTTSKEARFQNISVIEMLINYFKMFLAR